MIAETAQLATPRSRLFTRASIMALSANNFSYHWRENPVRRTGSLDSLKEKMMTTATGRYIKKKMIPRYIFSKRVLRFMPEPVFLFFPNFLTNVPFLASAPSPCIFGSSTSISLFCVFIIPAPPLLSHW